MNNISLINSISNQSNQSNATKKKRQKSSIEKTKLWNIFDQEMADLKKQPLECIYRDMQCKERELCERCESSLAFSDEGFLTCTNQLCGIIYKDIVDQSAEWRYYGADDNQHSDPTRCGMPISNLLEESSYGCKVLCFGGTSYEMRKIRRYTDWQSMPYKEKAQYDEFQKITIMSQNAGIPKLIIDDAIQYHKKISEYELLFRGDNRDGILAACIYISCRINNFPRTAKEIAIIFHLDVNSATKGCKNAISIINEIEKDLNNNEKTSFCKTKPEAFIERYCSKLNINSELTRLCKFISIKIENNGLMLENTPHSIAAGVVYFITQICNLNITKRDIKNVSEISEVTINKCYKKIEKIKEEVVPGVFLKKYCSL
jgi:transcription initiation factor TFIIB